MKNKIKIIIYIILNLYALSAYAIPWSDDLENEMLNDNWTPASWCVGSSEPDWGVQNGKLKGSWPHWEGQMLFLPEYDSLDYTIQAKFRIDKVWMEPKFASAGFIFRSFGPDERVRDRCIGPFYSWEIGLSQCVYHHQRWGCMAFHRHREGA